MSTRPIALVTGASAGIGKELARRFAAGGHDLILTARRVDDLLALSEELSKSHGIACHVIPLDLGKPAAPRTLFDDLTARGLVIDALVNNAGFGVYGPFAEADTDRILAMLHLNVVALTHLTRLVLPGMIERGRGRILNVASTAAFQPGPLLAGYYATKAYVLSLSEALSEELRKTGVTVTCLCPGPTRTEFGDAAGMQESKLFVGPNVMDVGPVADAGYRAAMRGQRVVVPGMLNWIGSKVGKFVPRPLLLRAVKRLQSRRKG